MLKSQAYWPTGNASKYLQQLCKHFAHKVAVSHDDAQGQVALMTGPATLRADSLGLQVEVSGEDAKAILQARYVIDSHLVTFAFRENFCGLRWTDPA